MALSAPTTGPVGTPDPPLLLADLGTYVNDPALDVEAQPYLDAAVNWVQERCGPINPTAMRYAVRQPLGNLVLHLPVLYLSELTELLDPEGVDVTDTITANDVDWRTGRIDAGYWLAGHWLATVTTGSPGDRSVQLRIAALVIAKNLWESQRGTEARAAFYGPGPDGNAPMPPGYAIPNRAATLVRPYRVPTAAGGKDS